MQSVAHWKKAQTGGVVSPIQRGQITPVSEWKKTIPVQPEGAFSKAYSAIGGAVQQAATEPGLQKGFDMQTAH